MNSHHQHMQTSKSKMNRRNALADATLKQAFIAYKKAAEEGEIESQDDMDAFFSARLDGVDHMVHWRNEMQRRDLWPWVQAHMNES